MGNIPEGALICRMDVVGLYPSIPYGNGLEAPREPLDNREEPEIVTNTLVGLVSLALESSYFEFNGRIFR